MTQQVVLVTHHLHLLDDFDRVVVLDAGRVVADGTPDSGPGNLHRAADMTTLGLYQPGYVGAAPDSGRLEAVLACCRRSPAVLLMTRRGSSRWRPWWSPAVFALGRIPARVAWAQLWPMRWFIVIVAVFQIIFAGGNAR